MTVEIYTAKLAIGTNDLPNVIEGRKFNAHLAIGHATGLHIVSISEVLERDGAEVWVDCACIAGTLLECEQFTRGWLKGAITGNRKP